MRLNTDLPELITECCVGLVFSSPAVPMHGTSVKVDIEHILAADVVRHLANRFEERQALDVADRAADLHDRHVHPLGNAHDALFDLVGDMGHYLHRPAEIVAATFFRDDRMVDSAGRVVVFFGKGQGGVPFIVAEIQIRFRSVVRHIDFPMLIGIHRARDRR